MSSRKIPFDENEKCDNCGKDGAFDFMGDFICGDCLRPDNKTIPIEPPVILEIAEEKQNVHNMDITHLGYCTKCGGINFTNKNCKCWDSNLSK